MKRVLKHMKTYSGQLLFLCLVTLISQCLITKKFVSYHTVDSISELTAIDFELLRVEATSKKIEFITSGNVPERPLHNDKFIDQQPGSLVVYLSWPSRPEILNPHRLCSVGSLSPPSYTTLA